MKALLGKSLQDMEQLAMSMKQPKFRGQQIYKSLQNGAKAISDISTVRHRSSSMDCYSSAQSSDEVSTLLACYQVSSMGVDLL